VSKRIFILDDEREFVNTLKNFLEELGYKVDATASPKHALEFIKKEKPEIVLFDYKMPEMDGDIFFNKVRKLSDKTHYILITSYRDEAAVDSFTKMGVNDIMFKPVDLIKLVKKVRSL